MAPGDSMLVLGLVISSEKSMESAVETGISPGAGVMGPGVRREVATTWKLSSPVLS